MGEAPIFFAREGDGSFLSARYRINLIVDRQADGKSATHISAVGVKVEYSLQL
jgi:hypothetical protein